MNWALITTVVLTLSSSYSTDFARNSVTVLLEQVVYAQADENEIDETATSAVDSLSEPRSRLTKLPDAPDKLAAFTELPYTSYDPYADKNVSAKVMVYGIWPSLNNVILIAFEIDATVDEVNAVLEELDAEIVGVIHGGFRGRGAVLTIKILPRTAEELERLFRELDAKPSVDTTMPYLMAYDLLLDF